MCRGGKRATKITLFAANFCQNARVAFSRRKLPEIDQISLCKHHWLQRHLPLAPCVVCSLSAVCRCHSLQMTAFIRYKTNEISILKSISSRFLVLETLPFLYIPRNDICFAYLHKTYPPYLYVFQMPMFYSCVFLYHLLFISSAT